MPLNPPLLTYGTDPEFFIASGSRILGSEAVIPVEGFELGGGALARDGVQVELHPKPSMCREQLIRKIAACFMALHKRLTGDQASRIRC